MRTLADPNARRDILDRLSKIAPDSPRLWGKMTPHQMICHLSDSMRGVLGEKSLSTMKNNFLLRTVVKWIALRSQIRWSKGLRTMPEMDQMIGGTPPAEFERDRRGLEELVERVTRPDRDFQWRLHPMFGRMSEWEWQRWAYLHADHHLRQFGA